MTSRVGRWLSKLWGGDTREISLMADSSRFAEAGYERYWSTGGFVSRDEAVMVPAVARCVDLIVGTGGGLFPFDLDNPDDKMGKDILTILNNEVSPCTSPTSFWEQVLCDLALDGNAYIQIQKEGRYPAHLTLLPPQPVQVQSATMSDGEVRIQYHLTAVDGHPIVLEQNEVIHINGTRLGGTLYYGQNGNRTLDGVYRTLTGGSNSAPAANNRIIGTAPVRVVMKSAGLSRAVEEHVHRFFKGDTRPGDIAVAFKDTHDQKSLDEIAAYIKQYAKKRDTPLLFGGDPAITMLRSEAQTSETAALREFQRSEVAMAYGVPIEFVGLTSKQVKDFESLWRSFYRGCLSHYLHRIEAAVNHKLFDIFAPGCRAKIDAKRLLQGSWRDMATMIEKVTGGPNGAAIMTVNEIRDLFLGLPPIDGGESLANPPPGSGPAAE